MFDLTKFNINADLIYAILINMSMAIVIGLFIFLIYKLTYSGVAYSKNFNITLILVTVVTAMLMMVIGSNVALSLGMVGALSIIRFRSAIKDVRDIGFLFWGMAGGLACGTGNFMIGLLGSLIIALVIVLLTRVVQDAYPYLLVIKSKYMEETIEPIIVTYAKKYKLKMKNTGDAGIEYIYEIRLKEEKNQALVNDLKNLPGNISVNLISYKGEIAG
ncbi:MAG: DUF4956 domain-containing protein [Spirochaetales bacterium]|nr:DUF4956 domain-containing protein [Spirochaetales bacterium]